MYNRDPLQIDYFWHILVRNRDTGVNNFVELDGT